MFIICLQGHRKELRYISCYTLKMKKWKKKNIELTLTHSSIKNVISQVELFSIFYSKSERFLIRSMFVILCVIIQDIKKSISTTASELYSVFAS